MMLGVVSRRDANAHTIGALPHGAQGTLVGLSVSKKVNQEELVEFRALFIGRATQGDMINASGLGHGEKKLW